MTLSKPGRDGTTGSPHPTSDSLSSLTRSVDAFGRTIDHLQDEYVALEQRHGELNRQLALVNEQLQTALEANRRLAGYLDHIVEAVPTGIIAVDCDGIVRLFNAAAASLLGREANRVVGQSYLNLWPARRGDESSAAACARGALPVVNSRRQIDRPAGAPIALSVSTARLPSDNGTPGGALEVLVDLSALESLQTEMTRMRTLAALGEMAATVAHEIRNPLNGMLGFAELLARHCPPGSNQHEMADKILSGAEDLTALVHHLLEFARDPKIQRRPMDWPRFLHSTLEQYEENARRRGKTLTLIRRWPESMPVAHADAICLRQAIWNVLENAEHAAPADLPIEFVAENRGSGVVLSICDRGPGIDPAIAGRVFSPFFTTREKGTGLGLATARKIVQAHGGSISISNREGGGAKVEIELPTSIPMRSPEPRHAIPLVSEKS
ncbi:MAG: PAS domain-containing protein [candidate division Zixibacteria bacterium]|nr:PAS domain-containing protein [candidate division Zixibacteria bacterium]